MRFSHFIRLAILSAVCVLMPQVTTFAQTTTTGDIAGVVTDPSGALLPDAAVALKDLGRGVTADTKTNGEGAYRFSLLPPGSYSVTATAPGFQTTVKPTQVTVGQVSTADFQLGLGSSSQTVTVTAESPLIQTEGGNLSSSINENQAANIPNPGNDLTYIAQIAPGSVMNTGGGGLGNFSSYGISAVSNLFTINGMDENDPFLNVNDSGATNLMLGQNEIEEVSVVTNGYSGQYSGLAGANINYVTRGGTNQFHGRATWYWNGRAMNANPWFDNATATPRAFVNANQYGTDIGGPIVKDKLFFYFNAEGLYLVIPTSVQAIVPSPEFEAATQANINTAFGPTSTISTFYQTMFTLYNGAPGVSRAVNTLPDDGCDGSESFINPRAGSTFGIHDPVLNPLGAGTPCALAYFSNITNGTHENLQAGRVDWNVTSRDRLFGRVQKDLGLQATVTDAINKLFNTQSRQPEWQGQMQETHSFGGGAVNQANVSAQWYSAIFGEADEATTLAAFPTTVEMGSGQFSLLGGLDFDFPQGRRVSQFQASDDFTEVFGAHTLKVGATYRRNWVTNTDYSIFSVGLVVPITLDAFYSGGTDATSPMPTGLAPNESELIQSFPTALDHSFAVYSVGGYVEDDWKIKPNLTVTLAFRLDHGSNPICFQNCFVHEATQFPDLSADPTTPYNQLLSISQRQMLPGLTSIEPQPRFGFAWQPHLWGMEQNTVVRGGVGIFYDAFPGALLDGFSENPPNDPQFTVFSGNISSPSDPSSLFASAAASNAAFQSGFASGGSFSTISAAVPGFSAPNLAASQNNPKIPQYQKWSLEVERQFGKNTAFSLQYVGNHGIHIYFQNSGINGCNVTGEFTSLPACNPTSGAGINPSFLSVDYAQSIGVSDYNGVTASLTHRYASGLFQINYTWSHALDDVSNSGVPADAFSNTGFGATNSSAVFPEDPANPKLFNYGSSDYDVRHSLNANYIWELPLKRFITGGHGPDRLLKGWNVNGSVFLRSGFPLTLVDSATSEALQAGGYGSGSSDVLVFGNEIAPGGTSLNCKALFASSGATEPSRNSCLNPADFTTAPTGFGNVRRNTFRGPFYWNSDFSLMKHTKIFDRAELVIGAQFFNVFNHSNFDSPVMNISDPQFGQILNTVSPPTTVFGSVLGGNASPRLIQFKSQINF